jgi:hypothetical protein
MQITKLAYLVHSGRKLEFSKRKAISPLLEYSTHNREPEHIACTSNLCSNEAAYFTGLLDELCVKWYKKVEVCDIRVRRVEVVPQLRRLVAGFPQWLSSPGQLMWDFGWLKWQVFSEYYGFPCQFAFHRLLHSYHNHHLGLVQYAKQWPH